MLKIKYLLLPKTNSIYKLTFKSFATPLSFKNKINNFYKHIHPDVLGTNCAPDIKQTNEKFIKEVNSYLESIEKGGKFDKKTLDFYVVYDQKIKKEDKETTANYLPLKLDLHEIKQGSTSGNRATIQLNLNNTIELLMKKITKIKTEALKGKYIDEKGSEYFEELEKYDNREKGKEEEEILDRPKYYKDVKFYRDLEKIKSEADIKGIIRSRRDIHEKRKLVSKIDRALNNKTDFFLNRRNADPIAKQLVNTMGTYKDAFKFGIDSFPPSLVYFDNKITNEHIDIFLEKMKFKSEKFEEKYNLRTRFRNIAVELCNSFTLTRLYISDFYSIDHMPGYLAIPYNFDFDEFTKYYEENKDEMWGIKKRYVEENKGIDKIKEDLIKNYKFKSINIDLSIKDDDKSKPLVVAQKVHINLKKFNKFLDNKFKNKKFANVMLNINLIEINTYFKENEIEVLLVAFPLMNEELVEGIIYDNILFNNKSSKINI